VELKGLRDARIAEFTEEYAKPIAEQQAIIDTQNFLLDKAEEVGITIEK